MNRTQVSKRLRFEVFARDGFTCKYCGRQSDIVPLHVDHLIPVCQGGTNDIENLITACAECNLGKGGKTIDQHAPTESDRLRLSQERNEQVAAFKAARAAIKARAKMRQDMTDFWCSQTRRDSVATSIVSTAMAYSEQFGVEAVMGWIEKAGPKCYYNDTQMIKYISGIRRSVLAESQP